MYLVFSYSKKKKPDRYFEFNPQPSASQSSDPDNFLRNLQMLSKPTMWGQLLFFIYEDYDMSAGRAHILKLKVETLVENMRDIPVIIPDALSHRLRKREDWTRNFRSFILRPILAQFTTMTVVHFPGM
jgi:hypothetical protein